MRRVILKDFPGEVDFQPNDNRVLFTPLLEESNDGSNKPGLIGGYHGDFTHLAQAGVLENVDNVLAGLKGREFIKDFVKLGKLGRSNQYYIPWMQATYLMVANRRALKYLPQGANLDSLTYEQLKTWAANLKKATGEAMLGFPVGKNGLMHRFIQGCLYPSYTGSTLRKFSSPEAEEMWRFFQDLWRYVDSRSLTFSHMDDQLLSREVWVAWDHTAGSLEPFNSVRTISWPFRHRSGQKEGVSWSFWPDWPFPK
jgi:multiple sugar transport system substrate-binding protein